MKDYSILTIVELEPYSQHTSPPCNCSSISFSSMVALQRTTLKKTISDSRNRGTQTHPTRHSLNKSTMQSILPMREAVPFRHNNRSIQHTHSFSTLVYFLMHAANGGDAQSLSIRGGTSKPTLPSLMKTIVWSNSILPKAAVTTKQITRWTRSSQTRPKHLQTWLQQQPPTGMYSAHSPTPTMSYSNSRPLSPSTAADDPLHVDLVVRSLI